MPLCVLPSRNSRSERKKQYGMSQELAGRRCRFTSPICLCRFVIDAMPGI